MAFSPEPGLRGRELGAESPQGDRPQTAGGSVAFHSKLGSLVLALTERRRNTQVAPCLLSI